VPTSSGRPLACKAKPLDNRRSRCQHEGVSDRPGRDTRWFLVGRIVLIGIRSRGRVLGRARVRADATFTARVRAPGRRLRKQATYVAVAGSARSKPVRAVQKLRFVPNRDHGPRQVKLRARLGREKVARIVLKRKGSRGRVARTAHPVKIRGKERRRFLVVTVPRPAQSSGPAAYWLKAVGKVRVSEPALDPEALAGVV